MLSFHFSGECQYFSINFASPWLPVCIAIELMHAVFPWKWELFIAKTPFEVKRTYCVNGRGGCKDLRLKGETRMSAIQE
jgi:hypothetical protein